MNRYFHGYRQELSFPITHVSTDVSLTDVLFTLFASYWHNKKNNNEQILLTWRCTLYGNTLQCEVDPSVCVCVCVHKAAELGEMRGTFVFIIACLQTNYRLPVCPHTHTHKSNTTC